MRARWIVDSYKSCDPASAQAVLDAMASHWAPLPSAAAAAAGVPMLTVQEVRLALKHTPRSRAPGLDGIPAEVWVACSASIAPLLAAVFTAIGHTGCNLGIQR